MYLLPLVGLLLGIALGIVLKIPVPLPYIRYLGIAVLAALDSAFGGLRASFEGNFKDKLFLTGFFGNILLASFIVYLGDAIGVTELYLAAVVAFGVRMFQNLGMIRRYYFQRRHWE
jgi:small basic protein